MSKNIDGAPKIINCSNYDLKIDEINILRKGPKFCPTPMKPDILNLEVDIAEFTRTMELIVASKDWNDKSEDDDVLIRKKSDYQPLPSRDPFFSNICSQIKDFGTTLHCLPSPQWKNNVTPGEREAITRLKNNSDIRITRVDKGSSWVILNKTDYINIINSSLNDKSIYKQLPKNKDNKVMSKIKTFTQKFRYCFDKKGKEKRFIEEFDFQTSNLYGLPKIHKSQILKHNLCNSNNGYLKIDNCTDIPFRLINGGENAPTSKLSEFLDLLLKPFCQKVPSYLRDYVDFLNKIPHVDEDDVEDIVFVTCDIVNMYGNITLDLGIKAIWYWFSKFPELLHHRFTPEFVIEGLQLIMGNSNFTFNGNFYTLIKGTATGTVVAPSYAILAIGFLEVTLYDKILKAFGPIIHDYFLLNWKRYLDDCFILWKKSFGNFKNVLHILNDLDPNLKYTCDQSVSKIPFLNICVYKDNNRILTDVFYKGTDTHDYLPFNSCHPRHIKTNIPKNLARMICCIVDDPDRREMRLQELFSWLSDCGYPHLTINEAFKKITSLDRNCFRTIVTPEESKSLVFVQTHNPKNPHVFWKLKNQFTSLINSTKFGNIFQDYNIIKGERQTKNLGSILQKSNIAPDISPQGSFKCNKSNCGTCPYLQETSSVNFMSDKGVTAFKLLGHFSCTSSHVIYKITCISCGAYYIGQTSNVRERVTNHKFRIFNEPYRIQKVYKHLYDCNGGKKICFEFVPFFYVKQKTARARLTVEDNFIRKFRPVLND